MKYLSLATSTFIVRVSRAHYRLVWSALTLMDRVPAGRGGGEGAGRRCIFRVVRVSGTIRKVEEEAIRRARLLMLAAAATSSPEPISYASLSSGDITQATAAASLASLERIFGDRDRVGADVVASGADDDNLAVFLDVEPTGTDDGSDGEMVDAPED